MQKSQRLKLRDVPCVKVPPRLRRVLDCLLRGDGEKRVAGRLGLSEQTVHQYVKAIYRHFHVHSRPELLARWIHVQPEENDGAKIVPQHGLGR